MKVVILPVGQLQTNCYLIEDNGEVGIVDPGDDGDFIMRRIADLGAKPIWVALTHGHFDHVLAVSELSLAYQIPVYLNQKDNFLLKEARHTAEYFLKIKADPLMVETVDLTTKTILKVGKTKLEVIGAPGHTPGGVCLYSKKEKVLFCGDLMFEGGGVGRTDFNYCSADDLEKSIKKVLNLPDKITIYPGHGNSFSHKKIRTKRISLKITSPPVGGSGQ